MSQDDCRNNNSIEQVLINVKRKRRESLHIKLKKAVDEDNISNINEVLFELNKDNETDYDPDFVKQWYNEGW